jgi:RHS repeat-associated protein
MVLLTPGFTATSGTSNPFVAKIGTGTENPGGGPSDSQAGANNPSGSNAPQGMSFHDTKGDIDVNGGGQLQFTLPIALPPGVKSVAPQVNLVYNSGAGNGIAGYGWNISGITAISRVSKNIEKDGKIKGVQLDYSDYYSFNGQRLILKTGEYGKDGAEYITEKYSNIQIKSLGSLSGQLWSGPEYWEVTFEDGSRAWYGSTSIGGSSPARTPTDYNIVRWQDAQGNYIIYNYSQNANNVSVISSIQWGGNQTMGKAHFNEILFNYIIRDLKEQSHVNGVSFIQDYLLSNIEVRTYENTSAKSFKKYEINYKKQGTNYQFVDYIKEKNSANEESNAIVFENGSDVSVSNLFRQDSRFDDLRGKNFSGDFNGDGKLDLIRDYTLMLSRLDGANNFKTVNYDGNILAVGTYANSTTPLNNQVLITGKIDIDLKKFHVYFYKYLNDNFIKIGSKEIDLINYQYLFDSDPSSDPRCTLEGFPSVDFMAKEIDFNGDGLSELILVLNNVNTWRCPDWDGTTYTQTTSTGNVKLHIDFYNNQITEVNENGYFIDYETSAAIDFDGDGKQELLENTQINTISLFSFDIDSGKFNKTVPDIYRGGNGAIRPNPIVGDYNGDGKTDILMAADINSSDWKIYISTGKSFKEFYYSNLFLYQPSWQGSPRKNRNIVRTYTAPDLNKDGKSDFVIFESQVWFRDCATCWNNPDSSYGFNYLRNEGVDPSGKPIFSNAYNIAPKELVWDGEDINYSMYGEHYIPLYGNFRTAQLNTDFIIIHKTKLITWDLGSKLNVISKIKSITQGGLKTNIEYAKLTGTENIYKSYYDTNAVFYPYANITENLNYDVVSRLIQGERKQDFRYRDMIGHLQGRGMIGFRQSARSTFYADGLENTKIWSGSEIHPTNEGLPYKDWSIRTTTESQIFPADISLNNVQLLAYKNYEYKIDKLLNGQVVTTVSNSDKPKVVTAINPFITTSKDFLKNIKTVHTVESYNNIYLPTKSIHNINDGFSVSTSELEYYPSNLTPGNDYSIGKPKTKISSTQVYGDSKGSKEEYVYENNLLKTFKTWNRDNTGYLQETNDYDGFGNITQKVISNSVDSNTQTTKAQYDDKGRFVIKKTDILGLETNIEYNDWGQIKKQTDPLGNILTNTYDAWGKLLTSKTNLGGTITYFYERDANSNITVTQNDPDGNTSKKYSNKLGQDYKSSTKAFGQGQYITKDIVYDVLGRKRAESEPYFEGQNASLWNVITYDDNVFPAKATSTSLASVGQGYQVTSFIGKQVQTSVSVNTTTVKELNGYGRTTTETTDALGNLISTTDKGGTITFTYNAAGEQIIAQYAQNSVTTKYDVWGRKSEFNDPSNGLYKYEYDGFGQTKKIISPKGNKEFFYNNLGQLITQKELSTSDGGEATNKIISFTYDDKGRVVAKSGTSKGKTYSSNILFDPQGRVLSSSENSNGKYYIQKGITYDDKARVISYEKQLYSSGVLTKVHIDNVYSTWNGELTTIKDKTSGKVLWELQETNAKGQVLKANLGKSKIYNSYDGTGHLLRTDHQYWYQLQGTPSMLEVNYNFDAIKNELTSRITGGDFSIAETFTYDDNNRLINWTNPRTGQASQNTYDAKGRILENDQVGVIKFENSSKIYQPTGMTLNAAGIQNYNNDLIQSIVYNENNDPVFIDGEKGDVSFQYGLTSMRQRVTYGGNFNIDEEGKFTKFYSEDGSFEVLKDNTTGKEKHILYIGGSPYESNIVYLKNFDESNGSYKFLHKDYIGSILAISDEAGNKLEERHFDAWGNMTHLKIGNGSIITDKNIIDNTSLFIDRGYTSHEHFAEVGIIHMNGRLYDPLLRRFLNADENIQDPTNTQNYNKYGYVFNNPLMFSDPSGEYGIVESMIIAAGVAILASVGTDYYLNRPVDIGNMFQSVTMAVISAAVSYGVGEVFKVGGEIAKALGETGTIISKAGAHALTQGTLSYVQGGNFWSGALAGSFSSASNDLLGLATSNIQGKHFMKSDGFALLNGATSGGIGSVLGGGNFWMGAGQGLIVTTFNYLAHKPKSTFKVYDGDGDYVGKMKVEDYSLYTDPDTGEQGIRIELQFTGASKKYSDYKWVQTVGSNSPDGGGREYREYNDRRFPYENKSPFYYANKDYITYPQIKQGNKYIFTDSPVRARLSTPVGWRAELSLVGFNSSGAHAVHTLSYGFNLYSSGHSLTMPLMSVQYRNRYWWLKK